MAKGNEQTDEHVNTIANLDVTASVFMVLILCIIVLVFFCCCKVYFLCRRKHEQRDDRARQSERANVMSRHMRMERHLPGTLSLDLPPSYDNIAMQIDDPDAFKDPMDAIAVHWTNSEEKEEVPPPSYDVIVGQTKELYSEIDATNRKPEETCVTIDLILSHAQPARRNDSSESTSANSNDLENNNNSMLTA